MKNFRLQVCPKGDKYASGAYRTGVLLTRWDTKIYFVICKTSSKHWEMSGAPHAPICRDAENRKAKIPAKIFYYFI